MIVTYMLVVFGLVAIIAKLSVIADTRRRIAFARLEHLGGYADRAGVTALRLQWISLAVLVLLTAVPILSLADKSTYDLPITLQRVVRGLFFIAADMLLVVHAIYAKWRYAGDVGWVPLPSSQPEAAGGGDG